MNKINYLYLSNQQYDNALHLFTKNITSSKGFFKGFNGFVRTLPHPIATSSNAQIALLSIKIIPPKASHITLFNEFGNEISSDGIIYVNSSCISPCIWNSTYKSILHSFYYKHAASEIIININRPLYQKIAKQILNTIEVTFTDQNNHVIYFNENIIVELVFDLNF